MKIVDVRRLVFELTRFDDESPTDSSIDLIERLLASSSHDADRAEIPPIPHE